MKPIESQALQAAKAHFKKRLDAMAPKDRPAEIARARTLIAMRRAQIKGK